MATILLVGAQPAYSEPLRAALAASRHEVLKARTVPEAVQHIESHRPAAVLLDLDLPGASGMEALSQLRSQAGHLPILVLAGEASLDVENQARDLGAADFLRKGLKVNLIVDALNRMLTHGGSPAPKPAAGPSSAPPPDDTASATILVVDDEPANCQLARQFLSRKGYRVEIAPSGEQALAAIQQRPPDLVLLDLNMPGINGVEVLRRLTAPSFPVKPPPGVILATASVDEPVLKECLALGASEIVLKPLDLKQLELAITVTLLLNARDQPCV
jgi:CheY-like chemotaxis protein